MFLRQLSVLLWKNAIIKRRQPVLLILELLWPVFLFGVILAPLRVRFSAIPRNETLYRAIALPSAGVLPFVQSVICDLNGGKSDFASDMPYFPNASVNKIYEILDDAALWNGSWNSICPTLSSTADISDACISAFTMELDAQQVLGPLPTNPEDLLPSKCSSLRQHYEQVDKLLALNEFTALYPRLANTTIEGRQDSLQNFLCGDLPVNPTAYLFLNKRVFLGDKTQQALANSSSSVRSKRQAENDGGTMPTSSTTPSDDSVQRAAPKVLYYAPPEYAAVAQAIIERANRTFESVEYIKNWAEQVLNCSEYFLEHFPPGSPQVNQVLQVLTLFNDSRSLRAKQLLDPTDPQNIWVAVANAANISQAILDTIASFDWNVLIPATSEEEMQVLSSNYTLQRELNITTVLGGVVMENFALDSGGQLQSVDMRIRLNSTYVPATDVLRQSVYIPGPENGQLRRLYILGGFAFLQDMLERAAMEHILGHTLASPGAYLHQMPYPCYQRNSFTESMIVVLPIAMTLAWMFSVAITVRAIVSEKEQRLKEVMRMMGLGDGALRLSWYITSLAVLTVSVAAIAVILKISGIILATDGVVLWLYLMLYACSMISYCFLLSVFFNSANLAACISALVYFMFFFAEITIIAKQKYLSGAWIAAFSLSAPVAFSIGSSYMMQLEILETGLQWSNLNIYPTQENHFTFLGVCGMLALDTVLYYILAWYLDAVFPGKYGVAKPWYFFLQPSFWLGQRYKCQRQWVSGHSYHLPIDVELEPLTPGENESSGCEQEPGLQAGIKVENLSKVYSSGLWWFKKQVQALKGFSLNFYEGQITALLGHNGAGKTTTMSLLTGLFEPSSGTAFVYGNDIRTQMDVIRQSLGVCPQFNVLFDNLTVEEHMIFYGQLKGMSKKEIKKQIPIWLSKISLCGHHKTLSKHLSGGMKRKLSIMMAFLGDPRTVILDEPTSGVDPYARRQIWDFLCRHRTGHTLILSTHHMDEAEILGDRIAIIANGSLLCCGSFEYLRNRFGRGHHLVLVKGSAEHSSVPPSNLDSSVVPDRPSVAGNGHSIHSEPAVLADGVKHADAVGDNTVQANHTDDGVNNTDGVTSGVELTKPVKPVDSVEPNGHVVGPTNLHDEQSECMTNAPCDGDPPSLVQGSIVHSKCDESITFFIQEIVPGTSLEEIRGQELHYLLPLDQAQPTVLAKLFHSLEEAKFSLGVSSYGLTSCSLDEIFVQLTGEQQKQQGPDFSPKKVVSMSVGTMGDGVPAGAKSDGVPEDARSDGVPENARSDKDCFNKGDEMSMSVALHHLDSSTEGDRADGISNDQLPHVITPNIDGQVGLCSKPSMNENQKSPDSIPSACEDQQVPNSILTTGDVHSVSCVSSSTKEHEQNEILSPESSKDHPNPQDIHPSLPVPFSTEERDIPAFGTAASSELGLANEETSSKLPCEDTSQHVTSDPETDVDVMVGDISFNDKVPLMSPEEQGCNTCGQPIDNFEAAGSSNINIENEVQTSAADVTIPDVHQPFSKATIDGLDATHRLTGYYLWYSQYRALLVKRARYTQRKVLATFIQNVLPLAVILTSLVISYLLLDVQNPPPIQLTPSLFLKETPDNYAIVGGLGTNGTASYKSSLLNPCGSASFPHCNNHTTWAPPSCSHDVPPTLPCRCPSCLSGEEVVTPPCYRNAQTGTRLLDLTVDLTDQTEAYFDLTNYLLRTEMSFRQRRYGGVSFGHERPEVSDYLDNYFSKYPNSSLPFLAVRAAAKAWYSNKGYHSIPAYLNTLNNAILRAHLDPSKDSRIYGIRTFNHPFSTTELQKLQYAVLELGASIVDPLGAVFAVGFIAAGFVLLIIEERSGKVKHLQTASGLNRTIYWLSCFTWDLCTYLLVMVFIIFLYLVFQDTNFTSLETFPSFLLLLLSYGVAVTPWMYVLSFLFESPATGYIILFCLNFFSGFCLLIVDVIIAYITEATTTNYFLVYAPFPAYALGRGMVYLNLDRVIKKVAATLTGDTVPSAVDDLWPFVASLWIQGLIYTVLVFVLEFVPAWMRSYRSSQWRPHVPPLATSDPHVAAERERVLNGDTSQDMLVLKNLTKKYTTSQLFRHHLAVNQLCFGVHKKECFGLLGVNGAGKTSTFRMLTGDLYPSYGDAVLNGQSVVRDRRHVQACMGYCPQVDALIDQLTGREHLVLIGRLRGLYPPQLMKVVDWALDKLGLLRYADRPAGTYSGGNKRKLSTAIALLTSPPVILLDEPTSGVDPHARHFLWDTVRSVTSSGHSVVLTTHSMAECEALCTRVGIMVNGSFQCLGTPQQLKSSYGAGYKIKMRIRETASQVKEFVTKNLEHAVLKEEHFNTLIYQLPMVDGHSLSKVFETMEVGRTSVNIEDYSVSQTTLDDVFIHFANQQSDAIPSGGDATTDNLHGNNEVAVQEGGHTENTQSEPKDNGEGVKCVLMKEDIAILV